MKRLIDVDALMEALSRKKAGPANIRYTEGFNDAINRFRSMVHGAKTVDAVEVVRCKDCKYWQDNNGGYPHEECRWGHGETTDEDDFCSYGERREG